MNKTKKTNKKPAYIVDITDVNDVDAMRVAFALAKHNANIPLSDDELISIITYTINRMPEIHIYSVEYYEVTKKPWYKRFWNWITRKKN